jgi:GMP synthase (glutamine-hydrolysing)
MRILALVHQPDAPPGTYADVVRGAGAELAVWDVSDAAEPPSPPEAFDGVIVLGGSAHPDQEDVHPWILAELDLLEELVRREVPTLGICLGAQLLARVLGAPVGPAGEEVGFTEVGLTDDGRTDPLLGGLPPRFEAFQWHRYGFGLPAGAVALARNEAGLQAFRHGDGAWAVQFHPEVDEEIATAWAASEGTEAPAGDYAAWGDAGARICRGFLDVCGMRL